jgi:hypothetical protein
VPDEDAAKWIRHMFRRCVHEGARFYTGKFFALVPVLRPELAAIYGDSPLVGAADQIASNGRPLPGTVLVARLAMDPP